ncbi:MAG: TonB-dependent receptor, partial [Candidatus Marinimicrobia bacterium]|nr:TonB-dependent receptor [Candidatus Neomarinimicrobiota bacterium]
QILVLLSMVSILFSGTTGKIAGKVTDSTTGEELIGVNVIISELGVGAATNIEGYFVILNVPPGEYMLNTNYIGYAPVSVTGVVVSMDLTTTIDVEMGTEMLAGETVVIVAERPIVKKDIASSQTNISASEFVDMPVSSVTDVVGLQAGVEGMSIRSGGEDEMILMMDGVTLKDDRTGKPISGIPLSSVQEVMIQSGGFNAEYSDLQAGLISVVTSEGDKDKYSFKFSTKYSPAAAKHFGPSMYDPNSYFLRPYLDDEVCWEGTENGAWDEHTQTLYPTFGGWNAISASTLADDDPTNDLTPEGAQRLFKWQSRVDGNINIPDYTIDAGFGGPVPGISKKLGNLRFFTAFNSNQKAYLVSLSEDAFRDYMWTFRLTSDITPKTKLSVNTIVKHIKASSSSGTGQPSYFEGLWDVAGIFGSSSQQSSKLFYPEYYCVTEINNRMISGKLTQIISSKSYFETQIEYSQTEYSTNPGDVLDRTRDNDIFPGDAEYLANDAPFGFEWRANESIGGIFMMGMKSNSRDSTITSRFKIKSDYTNQINRYNHIKTGVQAEFFNYDMNYGAVNPALPDGRPWSKWSRNPYQLGIYIQDKMEFDGWIATIGLRGEYFDPNSDWYDVSPFESSFYSSNYDPDLEDEIPTKPAKGSFTVLPRLGISHPITTTSKLYFNYGHMRQRFNPDNLFGVRRVTGYRISSVGDPELPMEKTVAYELGYDQSLFDAYLLHVSAYYKDKSDQSGTISYYSADGTVSYGRYSNNFYQDIRGVEFEVRKRRGDWLTGFVNYTYSVYSSGRFGVRRMYQNLSTQREYEANVVNQKQYKPLPLPKLKYSATLHTPRLFGPKLVGMNPLGGWNMAFTGHWRAGSYATYGKVEGIVNNVRWKDSYNVNASLSKTVKFNKLRITFLADAYNLFNFRHLSMSGLGVPISRVYYEESLHFSEAVYDELGEKHIAGDDRMGDFRETDIAYQPMEWLGGLLNSAGETINGKDGVYYWVDSESDYMHFSEADGWTAVPDSDIDHALDNKAYIYNPPNESFMFLSPRDIYLGFRMSYDF